MMSSEHGITAINHKQLIKKYLILTHGILHDLTNREIDIAVEFIYGADEKGYITRLLTYENRLNIYDSLNISENVFNTSLSRMKKKGFINGSAISMKHLIMQSNDNISITFNFYHAKES